VVDPGFTKRWEAATGFFGFFECAPDAFACQALLSRAEEALRANGMRRVVGPINLTTHDEVGLLTDGFACRPPVLTPYNREYYEELLEGCGYSPVAEYYAFDWSGDRAPDRRIERLERLASRARGRLEGLTLREADPRNWEGENRRLFDLFNRSFVNRWGFVPLSWEEYREKADVFRLIYRPELAIFAEIRGEPVGFGLALPDVNEILATLGGRLLPFGWLRLRRGLPRLRSARSILLAVRPEYTHRGIGALIAARLHDAGRRLRLMRGELSLIESSNEAMIRVVQALGSRRTRTFRLYAKSLVD
jgi:GNAT superfamily N-acetyltransferase